MHLKVFLSYSGALALALGWALSPPFGACKHQLKSGGVEPPPKVSLAKD